MAQPNETAATAIVLPSQPACGTGVGGSPPAYGPIRQDLSTSASVWYMFLPFPTGCTVDLDLRGSNYDTVVVIYSGADTTGSGLTTVGSNDDYYGSASRVAFTAVAGRYYYVNVLGYSSSRGTAYLNWVTTPPTAPQPPEPSRFMPDARATIATGINVTILPMTVPDAKLSLIGPKTKWPMIGTNLSVGTRTIKVGGPKLTRVTIGGRVWNHSTTRVGMNRTRTRTYSVRVLQVGGTRVHRIGPGEFRHWGGIGGTQRVPSFPQMPTPTTWPHSFRPWTG